MSIRTKIHRNKVSFIKFRKVDGSIRNMICTLDLSMIPKNKRPSGVMVEYSNNQIRVFDIVAQNWRSMLEENVIEVSEYGAEISPEIS
jgi:hypothetical protein